MAHVCSHTVINGSELGVLPKFVALAAKKPGKKHILKFYNAPTILVISSKWLKKIKDSAIIYSRRYKRMSPMTASLCFVSPWNQMLEYQALKDGWLLWSHVSVLRQWWVPRECCGITCGPHDLFSFLKKVFPGIAKRASYRSLKIIPKSY